MKLFQIGTVYGQCAEGDDSVAGLHAQVFELLTSLPGSTVLDIASGHGHLSQMLATAGYEVEACDCREEFDLPIPYHRADLNGSDWGIDPGFDLIVSLETIEHLENPWHFLRGLKALLNPGGHIVLSCPNIENPLSKAWFLLRGQFNLFRPSDVDYGHINPMTEFEVRTVCKAIGLRVLQVLPGGTYPLIYLHRNLTDSLLTSVVNLLGLPLGNLSTCKIYVIGGSE